MWTCLRVFFSFSCPLFVCYQIFVFPVITVCFWIFYVLHNSTLILTYLILVLFEAFLVVF